MAKEITNRIVSVNRRGFLGKAVGALAASTAVVVPIHLAQQSKREGVARALHGAVSQFDDDNRPSHVQVCNDGQSLNLAMDGLLDSSVEEIEHLLLPLFGGVSAQFVDFGLDRVPVLVLVSVARVHPHQID